MPAIFYRSPAACAAMKIRNCSSTLEIRMWIRPCRLSYSSTNIVKYIKKTRFLVTKQTFIKKLRIKTAVAKNIRSTTNRFQFHSQVFALKLHPSPRYQSTHLNLLNTVTRTPQNYVKLFVITNSAKLLCFKRHLSPSTPISVNHFVSPSARRQSSAGVRAHAHWCARDLRPLFVFPLRGHLRLPP